MSAKKASRGKGGGGDGNSTLYIGLAVAVAVVAGGAWYMMGGESEPAGASTPPTTVNMPAENPDAGQTANAGRAPLERKPLERAPIERPDRPERQPRVTAAGDDGAPPPRGEPTPVVRKPRGKPTGKKFMD